MSNYPDLKFLSQVKSLDIYAQVISQFYSQLMNASNKNSDDYLSLKNYTVESIDELKDALNKMGSDLVG